MNQNLSHFDRVSSFKTLAWNTGRLSGGYGNRDFDHTSLGLDKNLIQQFPTGGWFGRHEWTNYEGLRS